MTLTNNRKRTRGRSIQVIDVPLFISKDDGHGNMVKIRNPHNKAGRKIQVRHKPAVK
jgi:hypothetical protein